MKARVFVTLKTGVLDPQGKAIHHALESLGFNETRHRLAAAFDQDSLEAGIAERF